VEELRKEDDMGVEQRRDMVDLKEREAEQAEQRATGEREAIRQEEQRIAQERNRNEQERQNIEQQRQQTQEDQAAGRITAQEAQERQQDLDRREQAAEDKAEQLDQAEAGLEQRREEAQQLEDFAQQKTEEAQQEREGIAQDQQAGIVNQTVAEGIMGVMIEGQNSNMGRLVRIDPAAKRELKRSPLDTVYVRTVTFINGRILAIAGENRGQGAVRIVEINPASLEMARQGDDDINPASLLWVNGNDMYAIINTGGSSFLGRFDTNLALRARSAITVHPNASVVIQQGYLLTQKADGSAAFLNPQDLTEAF
ncbi:MAG: hypothetical protein LBU85_04710, partial [Treponema sp.]|jgi:hypothetical protein|nr:hypothetical protein [Treponema sp.]